MTKMCLDIKRTLCCVYYEVKYYYKYYFSSGDRMNDYNYAPLSEIIVDHQPETRITRIPSGSVPKRYTSPPPFNPTEKVVEKNHYDTFPKNGLTVNLRKRPSIDFIETHEKVLSPISERSDTDTDSSLLSSSLSSPHTSPHPSPLTSPLTSPHPSNNIKIEITDTDLKCEIESDSDDTWELITDKTE